MDLKCPDMGCQSGRTPPEACQALTATVVVLTTPIVDGSRSHVHTSSFSGLDFYRNISFCTLSINYLLSASFMAVGNTS